MKDNRMKGALESITCRDVPENLNLWPKIAARMELKDVIPMKSNLKPTWTIILVLLALILVTTAAFAYFRLIGGDAGLQGARDQGLITDLNMTAIPTIYTTPQPTPTPVWSDTNNTPAPAATVIAEQVSKGVKVTLDWAYADESRVAMQFTVTGLNSPPGVNASDMIGPPSVTDNTGLLGTKGGGGGGGGPVGGEDDNAFTIMTVFYQNIDADQYPTIDLEADLPIGGFDAMYQSPVTTPDLNAEPQFVLIPLVGNFHFEFSLPVYKAVELKSGQSVETNGVIMRLESLKLNRSHTDIRVCFTMPSAADWIPFAKIKIGNDQEYDNNGFADASGKDFRLTDPERCADLSFDVPYDGNSTIVQVRIIKLVQSAPEVYTPQVIQAAQEKLHSLGIEFNYKVGSGGASLDILKKPKGMSDQDAYQLINESLEVKIEGPWTFLADVSP